MADPKTPKPGKAPVRREFKYPAEDETFVRRLGSAVLARWNDLTAEEREKLLAEASVAWDREYHVPQLAQKLEAFVRRYPGRLA